MPTPDVVNEKRKCKRYTHLKHNGAYHQKQAVFKGSAHQRIGKQFCIVEIPWVIEPFGCSAQAGNLGEAVCDVHDKRIEQI